MMFGWNSQQLEYFDHPYNHTRLNSRRVEIPIARWFLATRPVARILEVGNVLAHYGPIRWPVVDLRESGAIKADVMAWAPAEPIDLLISISTVEHIGFGKYARGVAQRRPSAVLARLRGFLSAGGQALITVPTGYNPILDAELSDGEFGADMLWAMRACEKNGWAECTLTEALAMPPRACSNRWSGGLVIALLGEL